MVCKLGRNLTLANTSAYRWRKSLVLKLAMLAFCPLKVRLETMPEGGGGGGAGAGVARGGGGETPKVTPVEFDETGPPSSVTGTCLLPARYILCETTAQEKMESYESYDWEDKYPYLSLKEVKRFSRSHTCRRGHNHRRLRRGYIGEKGSWNWLSWTKSFFSSVEQAKCSSL